MSLYLQYDSVDYGYVNTIPNWKSRVYAQYRTKPKALDWYRITDNISQQLGDTAGAVQSMYDIDTAISKPLDVIGRIVVQSREFTGQIQLNPGLFDTVDGAEFGDDVDAQFAADTVDQDSVMSDELYRLAIKAKIIKNNSDASIDSILDGMNFLLPNAEVLRVTDGEDMSFSIEFYGNITELERWALISLSFVPKPQGVRFNGFLEGIGLAEFDLTDGAEFGDDDAEFVGFTGV